MKSIELSDTEIAYVLLALRKFEESLLVASDDDEGDSINDLLIVQSLKRKIKIAREQSDAQPCVQADRP